MMASKEKLSQPRRSKQVLKALLKRPTKRSERYRVQGEKIDPAQAYSLSQAIDKAKDTATTKFDSSVELHVHLASKKGGEKKGEDQVIRGLVYLPHGLGKELAVVILSEETVEEIAKTGKIDFDIALASPALMAKLGKIAKILGPKGKMPNPKSGTVTDNPEGVKAEIARGRVEYHADPQGNVHQMIGKASWEKEKLLDNARALLKAIPAGRIAQATVSTTMGPSVPINLEARET